MNKLSLENPLSTPSLSALYGVLLSTTILLSTSSAHATSPFTTEGKFSVGSDGSANYSIPIVVPPGTAGMQPQLALNYNSNGGNGIVGMGWGIDGLSQISRCPTTLEQDGVINGVNYTSTDRFCLDGQRLIATTDTYNATTKQYATTSAYGANGTEYRTESANFAKVVSYGVAGTGPAYFKVWTKSGQIIEYGNTVDSGIEAQGKPTIRTWGVNKISDTKGNYIAVTYTEDNANGEAYVQKIDYTGNAASTPTVTPYANLQFIYETRPDLTNAYQADSVTKSTKRLTNIKAYTNVGNVNTLVKDYRIAYDLSSATQRSRLKTLTECDGNVTNPICKQSVRGDWQEGGHGTFQYWTSSNVNLGAENNYAHYFVDVNGDGLVDTVQIARASNGGWIGINTGKGDFQYWTSSNVNLGAENNYVHDFVDVNGDGVLDTVQTSVTSNGGWIGINADLPPDLLFNMALGLDSSATVIYKPLTDGTVYTKDTTGISSSVYPDQDIQAPVYVVSSYSVSDGTGGFVTTNYQYGGLKTHLRGRGSLGFRYVKESSSDSGLSVTTFYRQDFPYIGLPSQVEKRRLSDNALLSVVQNTYANSDLATSTIISKFPYLSQSVEQAYELDSSLVSTTTTTNQYDDYGNVTSVKVDDGLGNIKTTTSTYSNNVGNWLLGRLIRSTVTSVTP